MTSHLQSQFQRFFIPNFVCVLTNKRHKTYRPEFSFCDLGHAPGIGFGVLGGGGRNLSVGICDVAPSTAPSSNILHCQSTKSW